MKITKRKVKMKKSIMKFVIVTLLAIPLSTNLFAQKMNAAQGGGMRGKGARMLQNLNLTADQKSQIEKLRLDNQKKNVDLKSEIEKTRLEIKEQLMQKDPDEGKITDLAKKVSNIQSDIKTNAISTWFKTYRLLDDKQKEVFKKSAPMFMEKGHMMMRDHNKMGRGKMGKGQKQG
jgi:Spy/CpxP family protein refolding chaperone